MMFKRSEYCIVKDITSSDIYDGKRYTLPIIYFCLVNLFCQTSKKRLSNKVEVEVIGSSLLSSL